MLFQRSFESRQRFFVQSQHQFLRAGGRQNLIKENLQGGMGRFFQSERWLAHFADALAKGGHMFGAQMCMVTETHLQLVNRLRRDARGKDLVQTLERVMIAFEPGDALLDREAGFHRVGDRTKPRQAGQVSIRASSIHGLFRLPVSLTPHTRS